MKLVNSSLSNNGYLPKIVLVMSNIPNLNTNIYSNFICSQKTNSYWLIPGQTWLHQHALVIYAVKKPSHPNNTLYHKNVLLIRIISFPTAGS